MARISRLFGPGLLLVLLLLIGGTATIFTLWYFDAIDLPFLDAEEASPAEPTPTTDVMIPLCVRNAEPYTEVGREHILVPGSGGMIAQLPLNPALLPDDVCLTIDEIRGRVLARAKKENTIFRKSDFMPIGTKPGVAAGIPPGKIGYYVRTQEVSGLWDLRAGDRFDLFSTIPIDADDSDFNNLDYGGMFGPAIKLQAKMNNFFKRATVDFIVRGGIVVLPVRTRAEPYSANTFTEGSISRTRPVQEAFIAIDPSELPKLTQAIAVEAQISAAPRSGHPEDYLDEIDPESRAWDPFSNSTGMSPGSGPASGGPDGEDYLEGDGGLGFGPGSIFGPMPGMNMVESISGDERQMLAVPEPALEQRLLRAQAEANKKARDSGSRGEKGSE